MRITRNYRFALLTLLAAANVVPASLLTADLADALAQCDCE